MSFQPRTGADEAAKAAAQRPSFQKTHFFGIKDTERMFHRNLLDGDQWITMDMHSFIPTRDQPPGYTGNWPKSMSAVCRHDIAFKAEPYTDCYICDQMKKSDGKKYNPQPRNWTLIVRREEVMEGGRVLGNRDALRKVPEFKDGTATGNEIEERDILIVVQPQKTYFGALDVMFRHYGTLLDRDYVVTRVGTEKATDYHFVPIDPSTTSDGRRFDLREPDLMARYLPLPDLHAAIISQASDDYYHFFFDKRYPQPDRSKVSSTSEEDSAAAAQPDADPGKLDDYANRASGYGEQPQAPPPAAEAIAVPAGERRSFD